MRVTILLDITTSGLREIEEPVDLLETVSLEEGLTRRYDCDARLLPYWVEGHDQCPRLTGEGLANIREHNTANPERKLEIRVDTVWLDIDPGSGRDHIASDAWREDQVGKLKASVLWDMGLALYHTRNGIRGVIGLPEPLEPEDGALWTRACWEYLHTLGVDAEPVTTWNLPYRAPFVVRDGDRLQLESERLRHVGVLNIRALRQAREAAGLPTDPRPNPEQVERTDLSTIEKITENRNKTLFRIGCKLRRMGMGETEIYAALVAIDQQRCEPPLQREAGGLREIATTARQAAGYRPNETLYDTADALVMDLRDQRIIREGAVVGSDVVFERKDDEQTSQWLLDTMGVSRETMVYDRGEIRKFQGDGVWRRVPDGTVLKVFSLLRGAQVQFRNRAGEIQLKPLTLYYSNANSVESWLRSYVSHENFFQNAPVGAMFQDVFFRVQLDRANPVLMEAPHPKHRATARYEFQYIEQPETPLTDALLELVLRPKIADDEDFAQKIELFWEFLGVAILGAATNLQKALLVYGGGNNAKSVALEIMEACFPSEVVTHVPPQDMQNEYRLDMLAHSRFNVVEEMPKEELKQSAAFKANVTGSKLTARKINNSPYKFQPRAAFVFSTNELVVYRDLSKGFERRWLVLAFEQDVDDIVPVEERQDHYGRVVASKERAHIVSKALRCGVNALRRGHYIEPVSSKRVREGWHKMSDQVAVFLEEACERTSDNGTSPTNLYACYRVWANRTGHGVMSRNKFNTRVKKAGFAQRRGTGGARTWDLAITDKDLL